MKKAFVTGGAGFIGSHLVDRLLAEDWSVTAVDNFDDFYSRQAKERNIAKHRHHSAYRLLELDIRSYTDLLSLARDSYDVIVHLAAKAGIRPSIQNPRVYQDVNVAGTQNLLEFARECGTRQFVFGSSSSVYGVNPNVPWRENDQVLLPISPYASTKVSGELLGYVYSHLYGIRFIGLRFFTVYGPRQRPDLAIHKFARLMLQGQPISIFGDGSTKRDYTFVTDIISGVFSAIKYSATPYEIINVGHNTPVTLLELVRQLEATLGTAAKLDFKPEQPGDVPQTWADLSKAATLLGYKPAVALADGLVYFAEWLTAGNALSSRLSSA
jgi:UDP-glucuronate 4-epimerase